MAIDIGTSPATASNGGSITSVSTASFARPAAGSLLVAKVMAMFTDSAPTVSGGGLTWQRRAQRINGPDYAEIWTAEVAGSGNMNVTLGGLSSGFGLAAGLKVSVVTGQHADNYIGATGSGVSTTNNLTVNAYTSTANNSRGFFAGVEAEGLGNPSAGLGDQGFPWTANFTLGEGSGIAIVKAANTPTAGTDVQFNADAAGTSTADWTWAALEILPGGLGADITVETIAVATTLPAPAVTVAASPVPAPIIPAVALPAPAVQAGTSLQPSTISVAAAMPPLVVTTEDVEHVELGTITVVTVLPAPAAAVGAMKTPGTITPVVALPPPTVRVSSSPTLATITPQVSLPPVAATVPVLPGDQISRPGQIEWRGTLLGGGTPYRWIDLTGWRDSPPIISGNVEQPLGPGSYPGQPFPGERIINWSYKLTSPRGMVGQTVRDLIMATGVPQTEDEDYLVVWDLDDDQPYLVLAHFSNRAPGGINRRARLGLMEGGLQWTASDPRLYSVIRQSATIPIGVETAVLNDGNASTPEELRIPGPATTPQVENLTLGRVIGFDITLGAGETLVVDTKRGNVTVDGDNRLSTLIEGSTSVKDFVLGPGANTLLYTAQAGGTQMEVLWRHATN